jgi:hypothetical protein
MGLYLTWFVAGAISTVMAGQSRLKDGVAYARLCRPSTSSLFK